MLNGNMPFLECCVLIKLKMMDSVRNNRHVWCNPRVSIWSLILILLTYLWSCALLQKPPIVQVLKKFPAFYGTRRFITVFIRALHWSLS
jgi:hypothetical protein